VYVKALTEGGYDDFYGIILEIYELEYNTCTSAKRVVVFYCEWFDPSRRGTRVDPRYNIVELPHYQSFLLILLAPSILLMLLMLSILFMSNP